MTDKEIEVVDNFIIDYFYTYKVIDDKNLRNYISDFLNKQGNKSFCELINSIDMYLNTVKWDPILVKLNSNKTVLVNRKTLANFLESVVK